MLMTVPGRRTGTLHELPVMYARDGDSLWVLAGHAETKSWWRNLVLPAEVGVRVRGKDCRATARAIIGARDPIAASRGLDVWVRRFPKAGPKVGVRVSGHRPDASDIDRAVLQSVVVRVRLGAQQESAGRAARALALIGIVGPIFYIVLVTVHPSQQSDPATIETNLPSLDNLLKQMLARLGGIGALDRAKLPSANAAGLGRQSPGSGGKAATCRTTGQDYDRRSGSRLALSPQYPPRVPHGPIRMAE
jgi:deazaflavin-dependent oxidoreductase (nitroreductase family)